MELYMQSLWDVQLNRYIDESRTFNTNFAAQLSTQPKPDLSTPAGIERARQALDDYTFGPASEPVILPIEESIHSDYGPIPVRIFVPRGPCRGAYLDIHGGGFYLGSAGMGDLRNAALAQSRHIAVVSVDYRLAPEHPWPAATDDCEAAALWLAESASTRFGTETLLIGGASAGATLAVTTLLRLRERDVVDAFTGAALHFGCFDLSGHSPTGQLYAEQFRYFIEAYVGHVNPKARRNPDISPLYGNLAGLPPVFIAVGTLDELFEDNLAMAMRFLAAGTPVLLKVYPESAHSFTTFPTAMARAAQDDLESWLETRLSDKK